MNALHPIRLQASLHETIWGGRQLEREGWKQLPPGEVAIGEAWETEINTVALNEPYTGKTLGRLVEELGPALLGEQAVAIFGPRFPLLAKFIDANTKLSVQVHPNDRFATEHEEGKLGKTECWYILDAAPDASIVHGFRSATSGTAVQQAIEEVRLEALLHEEPVQAGDVIFVPAGTVHAIGSGILLYELQEYSDVTYRMYDYGRLTASGTPRELHIERSLEVAYYDQSPRIKTQPVLLADCAGYEDRCLVACQYFVLRELRFNRLGRARVSSPDSETGRSCVLLSSIGAEVQVRYGESLAYHEPLSAGQTMVLPAALGKYRIEGTGKLLLSYVPAYDDGTWQLWEEKNKEISSLFLTPVKNEESLA
jgi:mannose-6-phosphate isomerase